MPPKTLEQLKKERDVLLKKNAGRASLEKLSAARAFETKRVKAEIKALKNPRSIKARINLRKISSKVGAFAKKRAKIIDQNLRAMETQQRPKKRKAKRAPKKRSSKR